MRESVCMRELLRSYEGTFSHTFSLHILFTHILSNIPSHTITSLSHNHFSLTHRTLMCIQQIAGYTEEELQNDFSNSFNKNFGKCCAGHIWAVEDHNPLQDLVAALGGTSLSIIFKAMLQHPVSYSRGQPDLLFWKSKVPI